MNKTMLRTMFAAGVSVAFAAVVHAEEAKAPAEIEEESSDNGVWASATVDVMSKYIWRGTICNDRPCWQPCVSLGYNTEDFGGLYASVWSTMDFTHHVNDFGGCSRRHCGMQELDYYLGYTKSFGDLDLELGHWFYTYPNDNGTDYNEIYFNTYYNNPIVTPGFEMYWAYQDTSELDPTFYFNFVAKHDFSFFDDKLTITPKASLGFGDSEFIKTYVTDWKGTGADGNGAQMTDQTTSLVVSYAVTSYFSIGASINYTWVPSHTLRSERWMTYGHDGRDQIVWGGVSMSLSF